MNNNLRTEMVILPIGYTGADGKLYNMAEITAMDGNDEESILDKKVASNGAVVVSTLLSNKIVALTNEDGDRLEKVSYNMVKSMFSADRDELLLAIRKISLGNIMTVTAQCSTCKEKMEIDVDLVDDVKTTYWDPEGNELHRSKHGIGMIDFELPDGVSDGETIHKKGWLKLPDGNLEESIAAAVRNNIGKANTALITACIEQLGDLPMVDTKVVRSMTQLDRNYLTKLIKKAGCGPEFRVGVSCPYCSTDFKVQLELPNFFMDTTER